jgi:hypothetical protein
MLPRSICLALTAALCAAPAALAQSTIHISVTNNQPTGGFATSPWWFGVHNGSFDFFNTGAPVSMPTETLAELGNGGGLTAALGSNGVAGVAMTDVLHPQVKPGETATTDVLVSNPSLMRYLTYAAMIVPSNDYFVGNDNPLQYPIFSATGQFVGPLTIQVFGSNGWDAGSEVDDVNVGPAFLVGRDIVGGVAENGVVHGLFSDPANSAYIAMVVGMQTPEYTVTHGLTAADLLCTVQITAVPAPGAGAVVLAGAGFFARRSPRRAA